MKRYTTLKVGYTAGVYGCSGEYFTTIILKDDEKPHIMNHYGMYGSESRVTEPLKQAGYIEFYTPSDFGKMTMKDIRSRKNFWSSEYAAIDEIQKALADNTL
jgi:hypothetical protein